MSAARDSASTWLPLRVWAIMLIRRRCLLRRYPVDLDCDAYRALHELGVADDARKLAAACQAQCGDGTFLTASGMVKLLACALLRA